MRSSLTWGIARAGTPSGTPCAASALSRTALSGVSRSGGGTITPPLREGPMADKRKLLRGADEAHEDLREAISGLDEGQMSRVFLGTWGAREIAIHISGWHREEIPAFARISRSQPPYPAVVS